MKNTTFLFRFIIIFVPLLIFMFLMHLAGITNNLFTTVILSLAFVWMLQAIYKKILNKRDK